MAWRILPGGVTALVVGWLFHLSLLQPLEQFAYTGLFRLRGELPWDERIVVIAIDDASLQALGQFPWSRQLHADLLNRLAAGDPSVVAISLIWSEPSDADGALAEAIAQLNRVVLSQTRAESGDVLPPVPELQAGAIATGHVLTMPDSDGMIRQVIPQVDGQLMLGLATAHVYSLTREVIDLPSLEKPLWVNWVGTPNRLTHASFIDVLNGRVSPAMFQDKIVLLGVTATGLNTLITPFNPDVPISGVYLHATVLNNLLQDTLLQPMPQQWLWLILLVGGPGLSWAMARWKTRYQLLGIGMLCGSWAGVSMMLFQANYLPTVAMPLTLFMLTAAAVALSERLEESILLHHQVASLWNLYRKDVVYQFDDQQHSLKPPFKREAAWRDLPSSMVRVAQLAAIAEQFGRSQSTQAAIARSLSIGLVAADLDGNVWFCNPAATSLLQITVGTTLTTALATHWIKPEEWYTILHQLACNILPIPSEHYYSERWFELRWEPLIYHPHSPSDHAATPSLDHALRNAVGKPPDGFMLLIEDITARKQIESNLNRQIQELNQLNRMKDDFLSTVSHELRSPLANINVVIQLLEYADPTEQPKYLQILKDECDRETELVNDLLDLQRLEAGKREFDMQIMLLQDWLPSMIEPFEHRVKVRDQQLQTHIAPDLPPILSDYHSLQRLVTELLTNACKYTPPHHEIAVRVQFVAPHVHITVQNSGTEIEEAELPKIFEKFYRIPHNDRWHQGGTGLGLALVKNLVEHLNGHIDVHSANNVTAFTIQFLAVGSDRPTSI
ncbi:CHASE2 domain-containing protein [Leptolyngbya sp. AN02str]|uniref:CHASE2 domain-containing protein n=1 Tax=Leptolyngbya sp. AN02str TaxID=3423363 RepID=UPI003D318BD4